MRRRELVAAGLAGALLPAAAVAQPAQITVLYIGAWDCPPCSGWKMKYKPDWIASPEFKKVRWEMVDPPSLRQAYERKNWPKDLWPLLDKIPLKIGTPRFIVAKDGEIVVNSTNQHDWPYIMKEIQKLVG